MVKHNQTILRFLPTNCLSVFDHFLGLALKGLKILVFHSQVKVSYDNSSVIRLKVNLKTDVTGNQSKPNFPKKQIFHATGLFLNPLKTSENQRFSDAFRVFRKRSLTRYGLDKIDYFCKNPTLDV